MAACEVRPPWSVTMAAARFMIGSQSGSVIPVTSTAPAGKRSSSTGLLSAQTAPAPIASPTAMPSTSRSPVPVSRKRCSIVARRWDTTVSGRAWTMKISPEWPSLAHSMSIGHP